ncbi:hypothetical protein [Haloprofundus halobius]|uniref:hypothetical protein n=1 Tax=Haloprofundus halobius TaxID=2876194 RepID=UPI001CCC4492|nr:hypothetical protein [Haloprofundus halobius]
MSDAAETVDRLLDEVREALSASDEEGDDRLRELADETAAFVDETTTKELIRAVGLTDDDGDHVETIPRAFAVGGEESVLDLKTILALSNAEDTEDDDAMDELRARLSEFTEELDQLSADQSVDEEKTDETEADEAEAEPDETESEADAEAAEEPEEPEVEADAEGDDESEGAGSLLTESLQSQLDEAADSLKASVEQMQAGGEEDAEAEPGDETDAEDEDAEDDELVDVGLGDDDGRSRGRATMHSTVPKSRRDMNGVARHSTVPKR